MIELANDPVRAKLMSILHSHDFVWAGREDPEDGKLATRFHHAIAKGGTRALLGFACEAGVIRNKGRGGAFQGPEAIRRALCNLAVPPRMAPVTDLGDIAVFDNALEAGQTHLSITLDKELRNYKRIVVLGGGHETAFGSFSGLKLHYPGKKIAIINLDAHLDLRALGKAGPSSGTPFFQMRELDPLRFDYLCIGAATESNTPALFQRAHEWNVDIVSDTDLQNDPGAADQAISKIIARNDLVYLTIDLDVLPHYQMPGVSAPAARGVSLQNIERLVDLTFSISAQQNKPVPVADLVELAPLYDASGMSAKTAAILARKILLCS